MRFKNIFLFAVLGVCSALSAAPKAVKHQPEKPFSPHFRVESDFLYWVPEASGLDTNFGTGTSVQTTVGGVATTYSNETDIDPSFQWNPGYRVSLGWQFDRGTHLGIGGYWEVGGSWTDFQGFAHQTSPDKWKARLYQIDLACRYTISVFSLHLRPIFGLRGTSILQTLFARVITDVVYPGTGTATDTRTFNDRQQFYGLGPLFGLHSDYAINYGLSVYGTIAFSLLYGNYHLHFKDSETITPPATAKQTYSKIKKNMSAFDWNIDLALGVQWEYLISNTCCLNMKLGLENHQYFDQSRLGHTFGNLSFSGGVFSVGVDL